MKRVLFLALVFCGIYNFSFSQQDSIKSNLPHEEITVNKEFDEQGNLTKYDSTYVYSWSTDSAFNEFGDLKGSFKWGSSFFDGDSIESFRGFNFQNEDIQDLLKEFHKMFPDPFDMHDHFSYRNDTLFQFENDSGLVNRFQFGDNQFFHQFKDDDSVAFKHFNDQDRYNFFNPDSILMRQEKMIKEHMKRIEKMHKDFFREEQ